MQNLSHILAFLYQLMEFMLIFKEMKKLIKILIIVKYYWVINNILNQKLIIL